MKAADRLRAKSYRLWYRQLGYACREAALCAENPMRALGLLLYPVYMKGLLGR